jgi:hypothetical protein
MPNTYKLITSNTLSTTASSVTFSSIPSTYTDLLVFISARSGASATSDKIIMKPNNSSSLTFKVLVNEDGTPQSYTQASYGGVGGLIGYTPGANATTSTFGNFNVYLPNYANTSYEKSYSVDSVSENNVTAGLAWLSGTLYASTSAISSLVFTLDSGNSFATNSSFYLYGIKNS